MKNNFLNKDTKFIIRSIPNEEGIDKIYIEAYPIVFNVRSKRIFEQGKVFYEYIKREAVEPVLKRDSGLDIVVSFNHDMQRPLARFMSGRDNNTLSWEVDDKGVMIRFEVGDDTLSKDVLSMVQRGDVYGGSFIASSNPNSIKYFRNDSGELEREINQMDNIFDFSIVTNPAYQQTSADIKREIEEFEKLEVETEDERLKREEAEKVDMILREMQLKLIEINSKK
jgi:uncharacterized protein